jgi:hypothetical protein
VLFSEGEAPRVIYTMCKRSVYGNDVRVIAALNAE